MRLRSRHVTPGLGGLLLGGLAFSALIRADHGPTPGIAQRDPIDAYLNGAMPTSISPDPSGLPLTLSATGAFLVTATVTPQVGLVPYAPITPLWSDASFKTRYMALPNDGAPYDGCDCGRGAVESERIGFTPVGPMTIPTGTVFVKTFELAFDERFPSVRRRLETRLLVRKASGGVYGVTYRWRNIESGVQAEADLMGTPGSEPDGDTVTYDTIDINGNATTHTHTYPSRSQCLRCHNGSMNHVLSVRTPQLNSDFTYPSTITDNQLHTWDHLQLFDPPLDDALIPSYPKMHALADGAASLETRARSYFDSNCAHCHNPGGEMPTWDARYLDARFAPQNVVGQEVTPGDKTGSQLYQRINKVPGGLPQAMPPLARNHIDTQAVTLIGNWIDGMCSEGPTFFGVRRISTSGCDVQLTWTPVGEPGSPLPNWCGNPITYNVYRSLPQGFGPPGDVLIAGGVTGSSYTDVGALRDGLRYVYRVRAVNNIGGGPVEDQNRVTARLRTVGCVPAVPLPSAPPHHNPWHSPTPPPIHHTPVVERPMGRPASMAESPIPPAPMPRQAVHGAVPAVLPVTACEGALSFGGAREVVASACDAELTWSPAAFQRCDHPVTYNVYRSRTPRFVPSADSLLASGLSDFRYKDDGALRNGVRYFYRVRAVDSITGAEDENEAVVRGAAGCRPRAR